MKIEELQRAPKVWFGVGYIAHPLKSIIIFVFQLKFEDVRATLYQSQDK